MTAARVAAALDMSAADWPAVLAAALDAEPAGTVAVTARWPEPWPPVTATIARGDGRLYVADVAAAGRTFDGFTADGPAALSAALRTAARTALSPGPTERDTGAALDLCSWDEDTDRDEAPGPPEPSTGRHLSSAAAGPRYAPAAAEPFATLQEWTDALDTEADTVANTAPVTVPRGTPPHPRHDLDALARSTHPPSTVSTLPHSTAEPVTPSDRLSAPVSHTETTEPRYPMPESPEPSQPHTAASQPETAVMLAAVTLYPGFECYINPERIVRLTVDHYGASWAVFAQLQDTDAHGNPLVYPVSPTLDDEQTARDALDIVAARLTGTDPDWPDRPHWRPLRHAPVV